MKADELKRLSAEPETGQTAAVATGAVDETGNERRNCFEGGDDK